MPGRPVMSCLNAPVRTHTLRDGPVPAVLWPHGSMCPGSRCRPKGSGHARPDLGAIAHKVGGDGFGVLIACAFNYDAHSSEFDELGRSSVLKARMNAGLHMADDLKNTGNGNLFVILGKPDIDIHEAGENQIKVKINGVDVCHPNPGEVRSDGPEGIACWFSDTDYSEERFSVRCRRPRRQRLLQGVEGDGEGGDASRRFEKPKSGRIAVKLINHLGDEG